MTKILIVDDEEDMLSMMETRLTANGFEVVMASDGKKALAKVKAAKPDLIISDVLMPNMDGFAFCKELKKDPDTAKIPVLILTARGKMVDTFEVLGVEGFLAKPFEASQLLEKINRALNKVGVSVPEVKAPAPAPAVEPAAPATPPEVNIAINAKKVFVLGSSAGVLEKIGNALAQKQCLSVTCTDLAKAFSQMAVFKPNILVTEVLVGDKPAGDFILKVKKEKAYKNLPILAFCFVDKTAAGQAQKTVDVEKARNVCMQIGVTECLREFDEQAFDKMLASYI